MSGQETTGQEAQETVKEEPLSEQQSTEETKEPPEVPEPSATGDENITILKHDIYRKSGEGDRTEAISIELAVKNVSDKVIGCAVFEAVLYDIEGNVLDTIEHKATELRPNASRNIRITYSGPEGDKVKSYHVRLAKTIMTPEPTATGNEKIVILKHALSRRISDDLFVDKSITDNIVDNSTMGTELAIRNVSDSTIATLLFEALFYDIEGNILDTVKHREIDLRPKTSRAIYIQTLIALNNRVKSYAVRITRTITADVEKVQLRRYERRTIATGEEEISGIVKNVSQVKTDAALIASFYDLEKENIGTKVIILKDIEPNGIMKFHFIFKPQEGDILATYNLKIGDLVE